MPWKNAKPPKPSSRAKAARRLSGSAVPALIVSPSRTVQAEAFGRQPDDDAGNAAVTDQQVRADADDMDRNRRIEPRQEQREVIRVGRLEQAPPAPRP